MICSNNTIAKDRPAWPLQQVTYAVQLACVKDHLLRPNRNMVLNRRSNVGLWRQHAKAKKTTTSLCWWRRLRCSYRWCTSHSNLSSNRLTQTHAQFSNWHAREFTPCFQAICRKSLLFSVNMEQRPPMSQHTNISKKPLHSFGKWWALASALGGSCRHWLETNLEVSAQWWATSAAINVMHDIHWCRLTCYIWTTDITLTVTQISAHTCKWPL